MHIRPLTLLAALLLAAAPAFAQAPGAPSAESRLREQVKTLNAKLAAAQAEKLAVDAEKTALNARLKKIEEDSGKLATDLKTAQSDAVKEAEKFNKKIDGLSADLKTMTDLHIKADQFGKSSADRANKLEAEKVKLTAQVNTLKPIVSDQRLKNAKMLEIAHEILTRYQKFGLGTALTAREPFVGITRARLESMVDDYDGRLAAVRIRLDGTSPKPAPTKPGPGEPPAGKPAPAPKVASERPSDGPTQPAKPAATKP